MTPAELCSTNLLISILRVNSLNQNYNLFTSDRWIVSKGSQNISWSLDDPATIKQRIDRDFQRSGKILFWCN